MLNLGANESFSYFRKKGFLGNGISCEKEFASLSWGNPGRLKVGAVVVLFGFSGS
jgi:hypothetical protein